jgi:NADH-quinone oxidoreductase subunit G
MGMIGRGEHSEIATFMESAMSSELSGNVIDLCPVGALTNKPFRYQARAWELQQYPMVSSHDCLGSNLYVHVRRGEVLRAVPRENENLNEVWLSDRDRYSVHALNIPERATTPMLKKKGKWKEVEWLDALEHIAKEVDLIRRVDGADKIASMASPSSTVEEFYLLQKLIRGLGSHHLDFRYHVNDFGYQKDIATLPTAGMSLSDLNEAELILVIGADTRNEVPLIHHRIRQAAKIAIFLFWSDAAALH